MNLVGAPVKLARRTMWRFFNELTHVHTLTYRLSGGRVGSRIPAGPPMLLLDHVGAKSGKRRTTPLVYLEDGEQLVIVASKGGAPRNPSWFTTCAQTPTRMCRLVPAGFRSPPGSRRRGSAHGSGRR